jgi:hypothetical protein
MPYSRTGLLIMRGWIEEASPRLLRVHMRLTTDVSSGFQRTVTVGDADGVRRAVDTWLAELLADRNKP